jgi:hypothetical protein
MQRAVEAAHTMEDRMPKKIVGPEHDRKDADQEEEAGRDSPGLSEREKAIAAVQTWKSRPPATASGVSGVRE